MFNGKKFIFIFLLSLSVSAAAYNYSIRMAVAKPTLYNFGNILAGKFGNYRNELKAYNIDIGYLVMKDVITYPLDLYFKGGLTYYDDSTQNNSYGMDIYVKLYYNIDFWNNRIRIGFGEGASYTTKIIEVERIDAQRHKDVNSHYLNYIDLSMDFDIGRLLQYKALHETYIGLLVKHRSGIFGIINNVKHGGSNYIAVSIEKNF